MRNTVRTRDQQADEYYIRDNESSNGSQRRHGRTKENLGRTLDGLRSLKLKIPLFHGKNDLNMYLEWEKKIELVSDCQHYFEYNKVTVAATEFYDYARCWWDQLVTSRSPHGATN